MEFLPSEVIGQEFLLYLGPDDLINYCIINKRHAKICKDQQFWKLKVASTPRRELQNDWFLYFARLGETSLLWNLYTAIENQGVTLDDRAITYAALYLLEQEDTLSSNGKALLESFLLITSIDTVLNAQIKNITLRKWFNQFLEYIAELLDKTKKGELIIPKYPVERYLENYVD